MLGGFDCICFSPCGVGAVYQAAELGKGFKVKKFVVKDANVYPIQVCVIFFLSYFAKLYWRLEALVIIQLVCQTFSLEVVSSNLAFCSHCFLRQETLFNFVCL